MFDVPLPPLPLKMACHLTLTVMRMMDPIDDVLKSPFPDWLEVEPHPRPLPPRRNEVRVLGVASKMLEDVTGCGSSSKI